MNIFLTGTPGCGKSSLVQDLIEELKGKKLAGIITPEIRDRRREGFKIVDLASGKEDILASIHITSRPRVGRYGVNVAGIDNIVELFLKSLPEADYIFLDEIGKMELYSQKFREMAEEVFESHKVVIAVVHRSLADQYRDRGELIHVERDKIDDIKKHVLHKIPRCPAGRKKARRHELSRKGRLV